MCEPEVFSAIADWTELSHGYGEEIWSNLQWWISGSFAVILTSHFARTSLNLFTTALLCTLYALFTWVVFGNLALDMAKDNAVFQDVTAFAASHGCSDLKALQPDQPISLAVAMIIFLPSMFVATIGYLIYSWRVHTRS